MKLKFIFSDYNQNYESKYTYSPRAIKYFNNFVYYLPTYGEFQYFKTPEKPSEKGEDFYKFLPIFFNNEGIAELIKENEAASTYKLTDRGRKFKRHRSFKRLIIQEINEDRASIARYRRDIYWFAIAFFAFIIGKFSDVTLDWLKSLLSVWKINHHI